jgi:hypothetical protein
VKQQVEILRGVAHHLSTKPDRPDRPRNAASAQQGLATHLQTLAEQTPRAGLSAKTARLVEHIQATTQRYGPELYTCFDHPEVPATTNSLEGSHGLGKRGIRRTLGTKSTANSVVHNLDADYLMTMHQVQRGNLPRPPVPPPGPPKPPEPRATSCAEPPPPLDLPATVPSIRMDINIDKFKEIRKQLDKQEEPARTRRSYVRSFQKNLDRIGNLLRKVLKGTSRSS